jgi:hypothetical protein
VGAPGTAIRLETMALLKGSPAIDAGISSGAPATDERGVKRDSKVDIGAYEARSHSVKTEPGNQTCNAGGSASFFADTDDSEGDGTVQWQYSSDGGFTWNNLSDSGNFGGSSTNTLSIKGALTNLNGFLFRAVFTDSSGMTTMTSNSELFVHSNYAFAAYMSAYYQFVNAYYAYITTGNGYAYAAYLDAYTSFNYAYYAWLYNLSGNQFAANSCTANANYYSNLSANYSAYAYAMTGSGYALYSWYFEYYLGHNYRNQEAADN